MPMRTRELADKWRKRSDILQFTTIVGILVAILTLHTIPEKLAHILGPIFMVILFATATIGHIATKKALKYDIRYLSRVIEASRTIEEHKSKS